MISLGLVPSKIFMHQVFALLLPSDDQKRLPLVLNERPFRDSETLNFEEFGSLFAGGKASQRVLRTLNAEVKSERRKYMETKAYQKEAKDNQTTGEVLQRIDLMLDSVYGEEETRHKQHLQSIVEQVQRTMIFTETVADVSTFAELLAHRKDGPKSKLQALQDIKRVRNFAKEKYGPNHFEHFLDIFAERDGLHELIEQPDRAQTIK